MARRAMRAIGVTALVCVASAALADGVSAPRGRYTFTMGWSPNEAQHTCRNDPPGDVRVRVTAERNVRVSGIKNLGRQLQINDTASGIQALYESKPTGNTTRATYVSVWLEDGQARGYVAFGWFGPEGNELCSDAWLGFGRYARE